MPEAQAVAKPEASHAKSAAPTSGDQTVTDVRSTPSPLATALRSGAPPPDDPIERSRSALQRLPSNAMRQQLLSSLAREHGNAFVQRVVASTPRSTAGPAAPVSPAASSPPTPPATRTVTSGRVQTKLKVNEPGDAYEQEADQVADAVMRLDTPPPPSIRRSSSLLQRQCSVCDESALQRSPASDAGPTPDAVEPDVETRVQAMRGRGEALPPVEREFFEERMGADFRAVRIHADGSAADTAQRLSARAFTVGSDVAFGTGEYRPGTDAGRRLLAHELTHVVQQGAASPVSGTTAQRAAEDTTQRAEGSGVCPVCGRRGRGTCACGQRFVPVEREVASPAQPVLARALAPRTDSPSGELAQREGLGDLVSMGKDKVLEIAGRVAPGLVGLVRNGPMSLLTETIKSGVGSWLRGVFGGTNIGGVIGTLVSSLGGIFATVAQIAKPTCQNVANGLSTLTKFAQALANNPIVKTVTAALNGISSTFEKVVAFVVTPQIDMLLGVFDGVKNLAHTIAGWVTAAKNAIGVAWNAVKHFIGIDDDPNGVLKWLTDKANQAWETVKAGLRPLVEPVKQALKYMLLASPAGPTIALVKYLPKLVEGAEWLWANRASLEDKAAVIIRQTLQTLEGFGQTVGQVASSMVEGVAHANLAVLNVLQSLTGIPLASGAEGLVRSLSTGLQQLEALGKSAYAATAKKVAEFVVEARETIAPYADVLVQIAMVRLNPPMLIAITAGRAWAKLQDCYKTPIIDFLLDLAITFLKNAPNVAVFGPLWRILRAGVIGFLEAVKSKKPDEKVKVANKIVQMVSGGNLDFLIGYAKGLPVGLWKGLVQPFELAYDLIKLLNFVLEWADETATKAIVQALAPAPDAAAAPAAQPAPAGAPPPAAGGTPPADGGASPGTAQPAPASQGGFQDRLRQMATELRRPVGEVVGGFLPAVKDAFGGQGNLNYKDVMAGFGAAMTKAEDALTGAGQRLAETAFKTLLQDGNEGQIGEEVGEIAGQVLFEVILLVITEGWIEALKPLQFLARLLNWPAEMMGEALRWLGKLGGTLADAAKGIWKIIRETPATKRVVTALEEIGADLVKYAEELLGILGKGGKAEGKAAADVLEDLAAKRAAFLEKYGERYGADAARLFDHYPDAAKLSPEQIEGFLTWKNGISPESQALFDANPELWRTYADASPRARTMLTLCASPCPANATAEQIARVDALIQKLGLKDDDPMLRAYLHRYGDNPAKLEEAIKAAEQAKGLPELQIITTKFPDEATMRVGQNYAEQLAGNPALKKQFDRIQTAVRDANNITDQAARAKALQSAMDDLNRLESQLAQRGVVVNGLRFEPEPALLGDGKHGLTWPDDAVKARFLDTRLPQGRFSSPSDVQYAVRKGAALGPGGEGNVPVPPGNTSRVYVVDANGQLVAQNPNSYFVKVRADGTVHAFPSADPPNSP